LFLITILHIHDYCYYVFFITNLHESIFIICFQLFFILLFTLSIIVLNCTWYPFNNNKIYREKKHH